MCPSPAISVLVPLEDIRGDVVRHLRTWTHGQTLDRTRYQMVLVAPGSDAGLESQLRSLLSPGDALARAPAGSHVADLWGAAVRKAAAPWLVFTEAHCQADPHCLAATLEAIDREPDSDAVLLTHRHIASGTAAQLTARWFGDVYRQWSALAWPHLNLVGAAVRADALPPLDVFQGRFGLFCAPLLSALLHDRGRRFIEASDAVVWHVHQERLRDHHSHSIDHQQGELEARSILDPQLCRTYFGESDAFRSRFRYRRTLARQVCRALTSYGLRGWASLEGDFAARSLWMAREMGIWGPRAIASALPAIAVQRAALALREHVIEDLPLPDSWKWRGFLRAQQAAARLGALRWLHAQALAPMTIMREPGHWSGLELDDDLLPGAYQFERRENEAFRWTRPVALLRLSPTRGAHILSIETRGMRGPARSWLAGAYVAGRRIARAAIRDRDTRLVLELPESFPRSAEGIVLLCNPLEPRRNGSSDPRRLGTAIFDLRLSRAR